MEHHRLSLGTESWNQDMPDLGGVTSLELTQMMNAEDQTVAQRVQAALPDVARAIDEIVARLRSDGRVFYIGAGSSGRLGVLDAAECPPTFNTDADTVQAIMAGGREAVFTAEEGAEDSQEQGQQDLARANAKSGDVVVGISASGETPYVMGALKWAQSQSIMTISLSCNPGSAVEAVADMRIAIDTGPEVIMGSTRLKAGTAEKMVLNMLSTGVMVRLGKTFRNLMVDMRPTNRKLRARAIRIVALAANVPTDRAEELLVASDGRVKVAIAMQLLDTSSEAAVARLESADGLLSRL